MPDFVRSILIKITGYGWLALLGGIGMLGYAGYASYKASDDHAYVARDKLATLTGHVDSVAEVTVTSKRRRGGSRVSDRYYEASVTPAAGGEVQKLRMALDVGQKTARAVIDEQITALYDSADDNIAYEIKLGNDTLLKYEDTRTRLVREATAQASSATGMSTILGSIAVALLGAGAAFLNRVLKRGEPATA